jgi:AraC-like DNA-binding protein
VDLIEGVLDGLKLQSTVFCRMELPDEWGFVKDTIQGAPFYALLSGEAWLRLRDQRLPTRLDVGDVIILPRGEPHELKSGPESKLIAYKTVLADLGVEAWTPGVRIKPVRLKFHAGARPTTQLVSGVFGFGDRRENPLLSALPRLFHLRTADIDTASSQSWLSSTVKFLGAEIGSGRPGSGAVAAKLADILFVQAIRMYLESGASTEPGWLRGIVDPYIARALSRIHTRPERPWTVASLAKAAGMSRSRFALRFQATVGRGPIDYLTRWRMYEAAGRLADTKVALVVLADGAGYKSEIAFSKAFKRWAGHSPAEFRRRLSDQGPPKLL